MQDQNIIQVKDLYKIFGENPEAAFPYIEKGLSRNEIMKKTENVVALRDINFNVSEGEIFVIMGLSGSGKSTLLRCVNRLKEPTRGSVVVKGKEIHKISHEELQYMKRHVFSMVFQSFALFPHRTVFQNVTFGLEIQDIPLKKRRERGQEIIKKVGLSGWENHPTGSLSGGMQQRVGLGRALAVDPEILLMDEPFSALDPLIRNEMQDELLSLHQKMKKTVLFVTHDLNEAIKMGDRIAILNSEGELVQEDGPEKILLEPADEYVEKFIADVDRPSVIRVETLMTSEVPQISSETFLPEAREKIRNSNRNHGFVVEEGKLKGILDLTRIPEEEGKVEDFYLRDIPTVSLVNTIKDILPYIISDKRPVPVVDDKNNFMGSVEQSRVQELLSMRVDL